MRIERMVDHLGRTRDTIFLSNIEETVVQTATDTIIRKYVGAGNSSKTVNRQSTRWAILGILSDGGIDAVEKYAQEYTATTQKNYS